MTRRLRFGSDMNTTRMLQLMTKPAGWKSAANPPLWTANIRGERLPPALSSISIGSSPPVHLLGNQKKSRGGVEWEEYPA